LRSSARGQNVRRNDANRRCAMKTALKTVSLAAAALLALPLVGRSAEHEEQHLTMGQLPAPVKGTLEKESAGGKIGEIERETEHGRTFYEAEIVKDGKESYVHVAEDGKVLKRETAAAERKEEGAERSRSKHRR
jgi:hypothetical protein